MTHRDAELNKADEGHRDQVPEVYTNNRDGEIRSAGCNGNEQKRDAHLVELDEFGLPVKTFEKLHQISEDEETSENAYDSAVEHASSIDQELERDGVEASQAEDERRISEHDFENASDARLGALDGLGTVVNKVQDPTKESESIGEARLDELSQESQAKTTENDIRPAGVNGNHHVDDGHNMGTNGDSQQRLEDDVVGVSGDIGNEAAANDIPDVEVNGNRHSKHRPLSEKMVIPEHLGDSLPIIGVSQWSHQQAVPQSDGATGDDEDEDKWQEMPAYAPYDLYDDDDKLIAREAQEIDEEAATYGGLGGAGKGYTRVNMDEDAQSASSMDDNTRYLFKEAGTHLADEDEGEEARDPLAQLQATKDLLTEQQRIAYVAVVRMAMVLMTNELKSMEGTKATKKDIQAALEALKMWGQKMMVRLYAHMEVSSEEQVMIEQLADHGVQPADLTPALMQNARVKNPMAEENQSSLTPRTPSTPSGLAGSSRPSMEFERSNNSPQPPPYEVHDVDDFKAVQTPAQLPTSQNLDIDLRWTVLCDLFLVLVSDSMYDSRSRALLERVGSFLNVSWLEICKFERRVTDALEMQEAANKENWNEDEHMENRRKMAIKKRIMMMGLATVGGSLVIGLSAGLLAPVIGAGLAAGFTTIGVAGTSGFLAGAGGAAVITTTGVLTGGTIAVRSAARRMGSVKTFEYRPLHNNKRVNLIVTVAGWMNGKVDDVRLPYSTVDPVMGDIYSVLWEPEMLQSMGQTINLLATEALTQGLQQVLGSTVLVALMASLQLPIVLTKLAYLIDNPWTVSLDRATSAGLILADSLIDRNLGVRPVTLVGFSLGSRVIFSCLKELANKGAFGLVQNVFLFGSPVVAKRDEYLRMRTVISGRFVNGYAKNDWILGYLFRATSGGIMRVAGLAPVEGVPGLENMDVTELVDGHMAYRAAMPRLLRELGWCVVGDDFAEIEDPDPDNHQERQREIIAEIDEARKQLEKEPKKKRFGFFGRNKKLAQKKEWEMYDEKPTRPQHDKLGRRSSEAESNILFDIEAIRAELASEQIEVREIESTLPPMKLSIRTTTTGPEGKILTDNPYDGLRMTKSFDESGLTVGRSRVEQTLSSPSLAYHGAASPSRLRRAAEEGGGMPNEVDDPPRSFFDCKTVYTPEQPSPKPISPILVMTTTTTTTTTRPELKPSISMPMEFNTGLEHNVWLEDDPEFGREQEITLSFE
ncbi:MAG: hypothetical protein M1816_006439 [Peltula sp. TS41687]|nr:MAG: hypothetical protein M1816_006439 [Peltula sp. TS41687]